MFWSKCSKIVIQNISLNIETHIENFRFSVWKSRLLLSFSKLQLLNWDWYQDVKHFNPLIRTCIETHNFKRIPVIVGWLSRIYIKFRQFFASKVFSIYFVNYCVCHTCCDSPKSYQGKGLSERPSSSERRLVLPRLDKEPLPEMQVLAIRY